MVLGLIHGSSRKQCFSCFRLSTVDPSRSTLNFYLGTLNFFHQQMSSRFQPYAAEVRPTLHLALPLVLAELGWMSMAIVDTMMVGRLPDSAVAMGAVSLGSAVFMVLALFGEGLLLGLDTLVAQAFGAGQREDCHRSLVNGVYLSVALTPLLAGPVWLLPRLFRSWGVAPDVAALTVPYTKALAAGLFPLL